MSSKYVNTLNPISAKRMITSNARNKSDDMDEDEDEDEDESIISADT
jgi:hypothetical protein